MLHEQTPWFRDERSGDVAAAAVAVPSHIVEAEFPPITSAGVGVLIVSVLMPLIATGWTGLRVWTRRLRGISPFLLEDILCYLGLVSFTQWQMLGPESMIDQAGQNSLCFGALVSITSVVSWHFLDTL